MSNTTVVLWTHDVSLPSCFPHLFYRLICRIFYVWIMHFHPPIHPLNLINSLICNTRFNISNRSTYHSLLQLFISVHSLLSPPRCFCHFFPRFIQFYGHLNFICLIKLFWFAYISAFVQIAIFSIPQYLQFLGSSLKLFSLTKLNGWNSRWYFSGCQNSARNLRQR